MVAAEGVENDEDVVAVVAAAAATATAGFGMTGPLTAVGLAELPDSLRH